MWHGMGHRQQVVSEAHVAPCKGLHSGLNDLAIQNAENPASTSLMMSRRSPPQQDGLLYGSASPAERGFPLGNDNPPFR
eukprot:NODE_1624_length_1352_cov_11.497314_g952_i1.p4 GENE.NODE_1624_length_1352_cov_11.497314_g952_i1~~NODE_1624_length_1352_cov_11.497314_g952_i1.p4  ORF type:complete len:79 (-),score=5.77 NODE_1624_length_1352_cov_11.497314_g952_i1:311-547(-)